MVKLLQKKAYSLMKVTLITEYLNPPYDEGIKKTVYNLFSNLDRNYELQVICRYGFVKDNIHIVKANPLFLSKEVKSLIKNFNPDSLIYLPFQSSTFSSYLRLKVLSYFANRAKIIFIALQPKPLKKWQQFIVKLIRPKFALTPSPSLHKFWNKINITNVLMPLLTDLSVFKPLKQKENKQILRKKYDLPQSAFIISHMGHLNEGRNLKSLFSLQKEGVQVIIVSSSSTPTDAVGSKLLKKEILKTGIIILDRYIENIEEVYQLSDLYIFPVVKENSSIGMPLSILEARACGIPVLTSDYGSVKHFLDTDCDGIFYSEPKNFLSKFETIRIKLNSNFQKTKVLELNNIFYDTINNKIKEVSR